MYVGTKISIFLSDFLFKWSTSKFKRSKITPSNCTILRNWFFENLILAEKSFAKALGSLKTCVSVNDKLWGKFVLSLVSLDEL